MINHCSLHDNCQIVRITNKNGDFIAAVVTKRDIQVSEELTVCNYGYRLDAKINDEIEIHLTECKKCCDYNRLHYYVELGSKYLNITGNCDKMN